MSPIVPLILTITMMGVLCYWVLLIGCLVGPAAILVSVAIVANAV